MKLNELPRLPLNGDVRALNEPLTKIFRETAQKVNQMSSGRISGADETSTAMPTTGAYAQGDFVRKSNPVEAGAVSSKYVITGWIRLTNGEAHVANTDWVEARVLTGN